jgi:hypothetical protein
LIEINSSYLSLQLHSDKEIKNTYKIDKIDNYKIVSCKDESVELEILAIDIEDKSFINEIFFTIRDCRNNEDYKLILRNFHFEYKHGIIEEQNEFIYTSRSEQPTVLKVTPTSSVNMIVHFTKPMNFNKDILNKVRYKFQDNTLQIIKVEQDTESSVKLLTSKQIPGKLYQLRVF